VPILTSRDNPKIKQARALRQRKQREATGLFLVEGIHHVGEALAAGAAGVSLSPARAVARPDGVPGARVEYLCYAPDLLVSPFAKELIEQQTARGLPCYAVTAEVFASLAEKENPQGLLAVVHQPHLTLNHLTPQNFTLGVALVAPQDPGNVGTILRTIDAVGASGLLLLDSGVDLYHPSAVRASMGALFWHPVASASFDEFTQWTKQHGYHLYGTSAHASADYRSVAYSARPAILLLGSEREGLSAEQTAICEQVIRLPMKGHVSSLNLAVAAGVMLYEMTGDDGPLRVTEETKDE